LHISPYLALHDRKHADSGRHPGANRRSVAGVLPGCPAGDDRAWTGARPPAWAQRQVV